MQNLHILRLTTKPTKSHLNLTHWLKKPAHHIPMLIDFFYTLRAAKLPVSVKELLALLEALQAGIVGPNSEDAWSLDDFYHLARLTLVKDEKAFRQV